MKAILLAALVCVAVPFAPVQIAVVKHAQTVESEILANDAQCCQCPCWDDGVRPPTTCGCSLVATCSAPCGYWNVSVYPIPWGPFAAADSDGCVDLDLLPVPQDGWVYWVKQP